MGAMASQITSLTIVYSGEDQRKDQSTASLAFVCGEFDGDRWIPRKKWPVTRKTFPFDDVIMKWSQMIIYWEYVCDHTPYWDALATTMSK